MSREISHRDLWQADVAALLRLARFLRVPSVIPPRGTVGAATQERHLSTCAKCRAALVEAVAREVSRL